MPARGTVGVMVVALCFYLVVVSFQAWSFVTSGRPVAVAMGIAVWALAGLGGYVVIREIRFGRDTARLEGELRDAGRYPADVLPTMPSGRPNRDAADALFARRRREAEKSPSDWTAWYRLGLAYDACGDRRRAREALRHAITIHDR